mgnify:CR=1 FL=1
MNNEITDHKVTRTGWPAGPWDAEPDRVEWRHAGLPCLILRNFDGALCGYAAVPPGHPDHGRDYNDIYADVHGGLTYAGKCAGAICHVPATGEPDAVHWFGFDCAHYGDFAPGHAASWRTIAPDDSYKGMAYVTAQVNGLAEQLAARS